MDSIACDTCLRPTITPYNEMTYTLSVTSIDGCVDTNSVNVFVEKLREVFFPNAFSPNNDGYNDFYYAYAGKEVTGIKNLKIFNRWGELVYDETDLPLNN